MISKLYQTDRWLIFVTIIVSLLLSLWGNIVDDVVNNDGIEYIKSARAILAGDWMVAVQTYKWPFYSAVIAGLSGVTGLSLTVSAYIFNALCYAWMALAFIALVRLLGGGRSALWFAALVILAFPTINKFRPYLIRDPAFFALFLSGCYAFFVYLKEGGLRHNVIAIACFIFGALFRVEGIIYLFVTQAYLFGRHFFYRTNRLVGLFAICSLLMLIVVLLSWWQFTPDGDMTYLSIFTQPVQFLETVWLQVLEQMGQRLHAIKSQVLVGYSQSYSIVVLIWSAMTIVFFELLHSLYYLYFVLWFVAWKKGLLFPAQDLYRPWRYMISVALFILLGFVAVKWFLSERYPITVSLLLLLATPFLLEHWYQQYKRGHTIPKGLMVVLALIFLSGIKSFDLATKKGYLKDAGHWMAINLAESATVYTNNRILAHYFGRDSKVDPYWPYWEPFKVAGLLARQHADYAAINIKHTDPGHIEKIPFLLQSKIIAEFINEKGSRVYVIDFNQPLQHDWPKP